MTHANPTIPDIEDQDDHVPRRQRFDIGRPDSSDIEGMVSIFAQCFLENHSLAQVMYGDLSVNDLIPVAKGMLYQHLDTQDCKFMVAYDNEVAQSFDAEEVPDNSVASVSDTDNLTYGWISVGFVPQGVLRNVFAASEFATYACLELLKRQGRARGQNYLSCMDPRARLLLLLLYRTKDGQARFIANPHLVINALTLWPEEGRDYWEMPFKLLRWAVSYADRRNLPIWAQVPADQMEVFRHAGFRVVGTVIVNLNDFTPPGSMGDWGTQEWKQMVYRAPEGRHVRSRSPRDGGRRQRRPSL